MRDLASPPDAEPTVLAPLMDAAPGPTAPVSRRSVLHHIGVGTATVVVAAIGVGSYRVFDNGVLDAGDGTPYNAWTNWRNDPTPLGAVGAAILAANPHNSQPWIFHVTDNSIDLYADPTRRIGTLDAMNREHTIGFGCALENLVLAAGARGYRATVTLLPDATDPTHIATVALTTAPVDASALHDAIGNRHSNRGPYTKVAIAPDALSAMELVAQGLDGVSVKWFTSSLKPLKPSSVTSSSRRIPSHGFETTVMTSMSIWMDSPSMPRACPPWSSP
jgi:hypothetical protein